MRRNQCLTLLLAAVLALFPAFPAAAANASPELATSAPAAYYLDGTMYAFALFPDFAPVDEYDVRTAGLLVNGVQVGEEAEAKKLTEQENPAAYMLLIDCSGSMPRYQRQIEALADGLLASGQRASVTVAAFGDEFRVTAENLTDPGAVRSAISRLRYDDQGTDISGGAACAVDYMKTNAWEPGTLSAVILVTDGDAFYSNNPGIEAESEKAAADALRLVREASPQILLHAVSFDAWEPVTHDAVTSGAGLDLLAGDAAEAERAGAAAAAYYDALYALEYPLQRYADDLALRLSPADIVTVRNTQDLTAPPETSIFDRLPSVIDSEDQPGAPESEVPQPVETPDIDRPEIGIAEPSEPPRPDETTPAGTSAPEQSPEAPAEPSAAPESEVPEPFPENAPSSGTPPLLIGVLIGGVVLLAAVVVLLVLLLRKRGNDGAAPVSRTSAPVPIPVAEEDTKTVFVSRDAIPVRVELVCGEIQGNKQMLSLSDSLFIGGDTRCDLVLPDPSVAPVNTRVYRQGGAVFIEDLNSAGGTALGGMRIYAPNQLRSGDEIMVGPTCFRLYF